MSCKGAYNSKNHKAKGESQQPEYSGRRMARVRFLKKAYNKDSFVEYIIKLCRL